MKTNSMLWKSFRLFVVFMLVFGNVLSLPAAALAQDGTGEEPAPAETVAPTQEEQAAPALETEEAPPVVEEPEAVQAEVEPPAEEGLVTIQADEPVDPLAINYAWVAFNDCAWASGQASTNITTYTDPGDGTSAGLLVDYSTGTNTAVTATITESGSPYTELDDYGGTETAEGTDAYNTFHGKVDMPGVIHYGSSGWYMDITFTGLSTTKTYTFATSANRAGGSSYNTRVSRFTLSGDDAATNASTSGVTVINDHSVYFSTGENTSTGYVARWTGINPGSDGSIVVRIQEQTANNKGYGSSVFMLAEEVDSTPVIQTTGTLSAFLTEPGVPSTPQTYTVEAANLTTNLLIDPPDGFEVSLDNVSYSAGLELVPASGAVPLTTIYVRLNNPAEGSFSGDIAHTSTGATAKNVAVSGQVANLYTLTVNSSHGSVALNPTGGSYTSGTVVTLTATAESGYAFSAWGGNLSGSTNPTTITMDADKTVTAYFAPLVTENLVVVEDTYMRGGSSYSSLNYGNSDVIQLLAASSGRGALLLWNVDSIPNNAKVTAASLTFYVSTSGSNNTLNLYNLRRVWVEGTGSSSGTSGVGASWTYFGAGTGSWSGGGASNTSNDRYSTNLWGATSSSFSTTGSKTVSLNSDGLTVVQGWLDGGTNNGVTIQNYSGSATNSVSLASSENATEANRPKLNITYYIPISGPTITTSGTLTAFQTPPGVPSAAQSYTVTGTALTADISLDAPDGFELATAEGGPYSNELTLSQSGGVVNATVYVRLNAALGSYSGNITHSSAGAGTQNVAVSGNVVNYYTLTVNSAHGTVTLDPAGGYYPSGTSVTLTAEAASGYAFSSWSGGLTGSDNPGTIVMDGNKTVTANYVVSLCTDVSFTVAEDTHMRSGSSRGSYNYGGSTTVRVNPYYEQGSTDGQLTGALLKWSFSGVTLPEDATLSSASLTFYVEDSSAYAYSLYNMRQAWVEGNNDAATGSGASWNYYGAGTGSWGTTGAQNTSSDRYDVNLWDATAADFGVTGSKTFNLNAAGVAVVQGWLKGTLSNNGLTIQNYSGTTTDLWVVTSSEGSTAANRPKLNFTYCVPPSGPTITVDGSMTDFVTEPGVASGAQTYTVAGSDLEADISISAPAGFEISTDGVNYASGLTLPHSGGAVAETTIYVRLFNAATGAFSGNITHTSTNADPQNVAVSGAVKNKYTLIVGNDGNGSVTLNPAGGSYYDGTTVTLTPVPLSGFAFSAWTGANAGEVINTGGVYTIVVNGDKSLDATFEAAPICSSYSQVATEDTYISSVNPTYNYGGVNLFKVSSASTSNRGALLKWDLSSIPSNATITAVSMKLYVSTAASQTYNLYSMRRTWVEGTLTTGAASTTSANWNTYNGATSWGTAGAASVTEDRYDTNLWGAGTSTFSSNGSATVDLNAAGVTAVQGWVANASTNFGFTIQNHSAGTSSNNDLQISSSENTTAANRPTLNVTYCVSGSGTTHTLTVGNDGHGSVTLSPTAAGNVYAHNTVVTLTPVANSGYAFAIWSGADEEDPTDNGNGTWSITMDTDKSITANFTELPVNVAPNLPVLVQPADDATNVAAPPTLEVTVSDSNPADNLDVSFYGRQAGSSSAGQDFTLIVIPDTQNYSTSYPAVFNSQTQWIANNKTTNNIVFATHMGDLVNSAGSTTEWGRADTAMGYLDSGNVPYSVGPGNHDLGGLYSTYFGPSRFSGKSWYQGSYDTSNYNNYSFFSASGNDFIVINLQYSPTTDHLNWADALLKANPARRGIVVQHNILNIDNSWNSQTSFNALKDNPNLFLMLCGHMHSASDGSAYRAELGDDNHTIHIVMTDYQDYTASGYLRILRFSPANDKIYSTIYSPYTGNSLTSTSNYEQMEMAYDMANGSAAAFTLIDTVNGVANGGNASIEWAGLTAGVEYEWYATVSDGQETVTGSTWSFTTGAVNTPPVITEGESTSVSMSEDGSPTAFSLTLHATDADSDAIAWSIATQASNGTASASGTGASKAIGYVPNLNYFGSDSFVVQVSDGKGGVDSITVNVTITAVNDAPVLGAIGNKSVNELVELQFTATASDVDTPSGSLLFSLTGAPTGAAINGSTGAFTWTPTEAQGGTGAPYSFDVCVSDGALSDCETISVTVNEVNVAPVLGAIGSQSVNELVQLQFTASASDTDVPANTLIFSLTGAPSGAAINGSTGAFTWTPTEAQGGTGVPYSFDVCVSDGALSDCETISVTVNEVNVAPVLTAIGNKSVNELVQLQFTAAATDGDLPANTLIFSLTGAPTGAAINGSTGAFTWTPTEAQGGTGAPYSFDVCVSDGALSDCETISVTVNEVNVAPVLAAIGSQSVNELVQLQFTAAATDSDLPANTLTFSLTGAPTGAAINGSTGAFTWTPTEAQGGTGAPYSFDVCVSDGALSDCETISVTVNEVNVAPVLAAIGSRSVAKNALFTFTAAANDSDIPSNTLTFSLADGTGGHVPDGASIGASSGIFTWTPAAAGGFTFDVCVSDGVLPDCETITITVNDETTFTISGNAGVEGATLTYDGGSTVSGTGGAYSITVAIGWSGTVTPSLSGYIFTPVSRTYSNVQADAVNQDYTAAATGTQDIALVAGWNLVSFRVHPTSTAVADVLASVAGNYDLVYAWDAVNDKWLKTDNVPESPDNLETLDEKQGFWIHMTAADTLTVTGTLPTTTNITLSANGGGWNLVGYPSAASGALPGILTSHGVAAENLELIYAYHAADADSWKLFDSNGAPYANDLTTLSAGWGYWIQVDTADATWVVNY